MPFNKVLLRGFIIILCNIAINGYYANTYAEHTAKDHTSVDEAIYIETLYGPMLIADQAVKDILASKAMKRLKRIHQYGTWGFLKKYSIEYTRHTHSLGVYYLLVKFGASREECIFGLIHDISHTIFSHVADYMRGLLTAKKSYQDDILAWYVHHTDLKEILEKHDLIHIITDEMQETFIMLKNCLPNLCIDRLEYNLCGGLIDNILTENDITFIVNSLIYTNHTFVFNNTYAAKLFALTSIKLSVLNWCDSTNCFVYQETANMLLYALEKQIISSDDFHFSDDETVWHLLHNTNDNQIQEHIKYLQQHHLYCYQSSEDNYDFAVKTKFRGIDPFVQTAEGYIKKLSELDAAFAKYFNYAQAYCAKPIYIKKISYSDMRTVN
ncbi:hypothetical protein EKK58_03605 [Candidatus Dependentiae bacterium]|nr:MAG: hypothetical protein EKK58_03605 [Candidatus Dependentiae bacterium]